MKNNPFTGTGVALVTPFKNNYSVDTDALVRIVSHIIENGADFLVALGTTSEAPTLTTEEKRLVVSTILKANAGRLPVMLGIGQAFGLDVLPIAITMLILRISATFICPMTAAVLLGTGMADVPIKKHIKASALYVWLFSLLCLVFAALIGWVSF